MTEVIKSRSSAAKQSIVNITKNVTEFTVASAMVIVSAHSGYSAKTEPHVTAFTYVLAASAAVIAVYAFIQLVRHFNK